MRIDLGAAKKVLGIGIVGSGSGTVTLQVEDDSGRHPIDGMSSRALTLSPERWTSLAGAATPTAARLVLTWVSGGVPSQLGDVVLWVAGHARDALSEANLAERLVTSLPDNAIEARATPEVASVTRVTPKGPQSAQFVVKLDRDPALFGRVFLVYELERLAHWTGPSRSINGHLLRGGYRADVRGLGGVQVEEISPAWLHRGDNAISFTPSQAEDGLGYVVRNARIVGAPPGSAGGPSRAGQGKPGPLDDGSADTGLGGPGVHTAKLRGPGADDPAYFAFRLDQAGAGTIVVSSVSADRRRRGQVEIDLTGRTPGWQSVPLAGVLPPSAEFRVALRTAGEGTARLSEARLLSQPAPIGNDPIAIAYPLHGECFDHQVYVRGFVRGAGSRAGATLAANRQALPGAIDADGSFAATVPEPASARGKPWTLSLDVTAAGGDHATRAVPIDKCIEPPKQRVAGMSPPIEDVGAPFAAVVSPRQARVLSFGSATLEIPAGAVDRDVRVTVRPLSQDRLPPLGPLMTNVMPGGGAYRLGPHGLVFKKPVRLTLPVDPARVPAGMAANDVQTFYYDEGHGKWITLGRRTAGREQIVAMTGHFTDFISATLAVPDHPDAQLFNPNTIKGMKLGDPGAGITLIDPPQADASGAAQLQYPIETPPGRNGIQPSIALSYSSDRVNSNGWLGVGWDLTMSSIEVDTRFGVPRYDSGGQSEIYLLDGAMLTPNPNGDGTYVRRIEGRFDRIERKGNNPTDFSWVVTDKNGTKFTYGGSPASRLYDARNGKAPNIFKWALDLVEDAFGNTMTVGYSHDPFPMGRETFDQLYPALISYTGGRSLAPAYSVAFTVDDGSTRLDKIITGRPGFPVATRRRLSQIDVAFGTTPIRSYVFEYDDSHLTGSFGKSRLAAVSLRSRPTNNAATELYRHTFDYENAPPADGMFAGPQVWGQLHQPDGSSRDDDGLVHEQNELYGASGSFGFGLPGGIASVTISGGGDTGSTVPNLLFVDTNGDGLPDQLDNGGHADLNTLLTGDPEAHLGRRDFSGSPGTIGHSNRSGWTVNAGLSALDGALGAGVGYARHTAEDDETVIDMDGDGFPDIVRLLAGTLKVYLNDGTYHFQAPIDWGDYSLAGALFSNSDRVDAAGRAGAFFPADPLIRWTAPFPGTVTIDTTLTKARKGGDGVRADLFVGTDLSPRWTCQFGPDDDTSSPCPQTVTVPVSTGTSVYLKTTAKVGTGSSSTFDDLIPSMEITYAVGNPDLLQDREPTGAPVYRFNYGNDFALAGLPAIPWTATADGDVVASGCFEKDPTADNITAAVVQRRGPAATPTVVQELALEVGSQETGTFCIPGLDHSVSVLAEDRLAFEIRSDGQIDPRGVRWSAGAAYQSYCREDVRTGARACAAPVCDGGFCTIGPSDPLRDFPIPEGFTHSSVPAFFRAFQWAFQLTPTGDPVGEPTRAFIVGNKTTVRVRWPLQRAPRSTERTVALVQGVGRLIKKVILDGAVTGALIDEDVDVQPGEHLFFTVFAPSGPELSGAGPTVDGQGAQVNSRFSDPTLDNNGSGLLTPRDPMSGGYHRWFFGDWNGSKSFNPAAIRPATSPSSRDDFLFATPSPAGTPLRPDLGASPMWLGRGTAELMAAGLIVPGFSASSASSTSTGDGVSAIREADTWNVDLSAHAGLSVGFNSGDSTTQVDLFDVNGDRFPDSVTQDSVQFNDAAGHSFSQRTSVPMGFDDVRSTEHAAARFAIDLGELEHLINVVSGRAEPGKTVATAVIAGATDYGVNGTHVDFIDINGDGLPDHVRKEADDDSIKVRLNLGYAFSDEIPWSLPGGWSADHVDAKVIGFSFDGITDALNLVPGSPASTNVLRFADSQTNSLSLGGGTQTFGGSGGPNFSLTRKISDFIDVNGDGLPDQILKVPGDDSESPLLHVRLNYGDHFGPETTWTVPLWDVSLAQPDYTRLTGVDGVGFATRAGWAASMHFEICFVYCVGGSAFYSRDNGGDNMAFEDVDGDGKPDQVLKLVDDPRVHVKLNQTGKTNLLRTVHRPLGGNIALTYKRVGNVVALDQSPKIDMPTNQWALASVSVDSGQAASQPTPLTQTIQYTATRDAAVIGFYDRRERDSYGYADVKTLFADGSSVARTYNNQDYYQRGLAASTTWNQTELPPPVVSQALKRDTYTYADPGGKDPTAQPPRTGTFFPAPRTVDTFFIEVDPAGRAKHHQEIKQFDGAGNLTDLADAGDVDFADPGDDVNYHIDYVHPDAAGLITRPSAITASTGLGTIGGMPPGALLRQRTATYSPEGKPLTVTSTIVGGKDPTGVPRTESAPGLATWTFTYDPFGNIQTGAGPEGHAFAYEYDPTTQSHRTKNIDSSFGYVSKADYDLRFGIAKAITDVDGAREETDFDDFGRIFQVFGPKDFAAGGARTTPSLTFDYGEQPHAASGFVEALPASATTSHKNVVPSEMSRPGDPIPARPPIRTVTFADGLQRILQTKKDITRDDGQGSVADGMSVSGAVEFDVRGRVARQGQPVFRQAGTTFVGDVPMINPTTIAYDALSRERQVARPDSSSVDAAAHGNQDVTTTSYQLGEIDGRLFRLKLVRDPRGEVRSIYQSVRDEIVAIDEVNKVRGVDNVHIVTRYGYDQLSEITTVTDTKDNVTTAAYDTIGKMVALTNPDAGRTEWRYDRAGNATVKETPNLRAAGTLINYVYNNDRLERVDYPTSAGVKYVYGGSTEIGSAHGFVAGRVKTRIDESGQVDFTYDELGDVVKETSALVSFLPSQKDGYRTVMTYSYDSFGRMIEMQFPGASAEIVRYGYDAGGMVTSARGLDTVIKPPSKNPDSLYLKHIGYDEFGQQTRIVHGNSVEARYTYELDTRRLSHVDADFIDKTGLLPMQRLRYAYDVAGNVRTLGNAVPVDGKINPVTVGPTSYGFDYDRLNQLTHVDGLYQTSPNKRFRHSLDYVVDEIGNIAQKTQKDFQDQTGKNGVFQEGNAIPETTYDLAYRYAGAAPHAVTHVDESLHQNLAVARDFVHDRDGNQAGWTLTNGQIRVEQWSEEDRLRQVTDQGHVLGQYLYNAEGTRTHNFADGRELVYVNQYLTLRNNGPYITKHIYAGDARVASRLDGDVSPPSTIFYYHPDHLQSTQYTTTDDGSLSEHVEYFASGEPWKEERTNLLADIRPEFLFNGKELDTLTGFYYFGARYYDPVVQNWQSTDPILGGYMHGSPSGGVYNRSNLSVYTYAWNNPVRVVDPSGLVAYDTEHKQWVTEAGDDISRIAQQTGFTEAETAKNNQQLGYGPYSAGMPVNIPQTNRILTFQMAAEQLGSELWARNVAKESFGKDTDKCNLFVSNMVEWGGHMPFPKHEKGGPALAGQLGDASVDLPGTKVISQEEAKIGDVVANKRPEFTHATGHSGIYAGDVTIITPRGTYAPPIGEQGQIHANDKQVVRRSFEYMRSEKYVNPVFRRIFIPK